jgi:hypothetical protein
LLAKLRRLIAVDRLARLVCVSIDERESEWRLSPRDAGRLHALLSRSGKHASR